MALSRAPLQGLNAHFPLRETLEPGTSPTRKTLSVPLVRGSSSFKASVNSHDTTQPSATSPVDNGKANTAVGAIDDELPQEHVLVDGADGGQFKEDEQTRMSLATATVHAGERSGRPRVADALTTPLVMTSTYFFNDTQHLIGFVEGRTASFEYGRYGNPTVATVESKISELEGAEATLLSASGMCAATTMLLALVPEGGHIVTTTDCYRGTRQFIQTVLPKMGITTTVVDPADSKGLEEALERNQVSLFFSESPTNPYLRCIDVERIAALCHAKGAIVCIDSTFATPINQQAIPLGADLILHSATKYLAGHNDVMGGSLSGKKELVGKVRQLHNVLGGVVDPHAAYLILRGMKTLDLRVKRQNDTALRLAHALEKHPKVLRVHYPGLESHPEHGIALKQMKGGFGGVVSFEIDGDLKRTSDFIDGLKIPYMAPSLGGVESLVEQPTIASYWDSGPEERAALGIKDNTVRYCCGIESYEDLLADFLQSLDRI